MGLITVRIYPTVGCATNLTIASSPKIGIISAEQIKVELPIKTETYTL